MGLKFKLYVLIWHFMKYLILVGLIIICKRIFIDLLEIFIYNWYSIILNSYTCIKCLFSQLHSIYLKCGWIIFLFDRISVIAARFKEKILWVEKEKLMQLKMLMFLVLFYIYLFHSIAFHCDTLLKSMQFGFLDLSIFATK